MLALVRYAHEHGPWDENTCDWAEMEGHLDCLKYAHEHGCPWDEQTCAGAALSGQLECLQYAHEHGCPWDGRTCNLAVASSSAYSTHTSKAACGMKLRANTPR